MEMRERIQMIMDRESLTPSLFADRLKVGRPVISHILTGRNNASLDVVTRILETFDYIDTEWLLFGKGNMLKGSAETFSKLEDNIQPHAPIIKDLFTDEDTKSTTATSSEGAQTSAQQILNDTPIENIRIPYIPPSNTIKSKKVTKIILYYDDKSYQAFNPSESGL